MLKYTAFFMGGDDLMDEIVFREYCMFSNNKSSRSGIIVKYLTIPQVFQDRRLLQKKLI